MFFGKKNHLIGLDIGSRSIKVAEVMVSKKGRTLKKFGVIDVAPGAIDDGTIKGPEVVAESIRQLLKTHGIKENHVAVSIGGYSVIVKTINMATMGEEELQHNIHLEAEQYIPFDIEDVNLDFQILGESLIDPSQMSVLLVAAKKDVIEGYVNLVESAGLIPCIIDVDTFALHNLYEAAYLEGAADASPKECVGLLDVGGSKASLNILQDNKSLFMRDFSVGCNQINEQIMVQTSCLPEEAEIIKKERKSAELSPEEYSHLESTVVAGWCNEIGRALDFFFSSHVDLRVTRFILSGGGAYVKSFRDLLAQQTTAQVDIVNPFNNVCLEKNGLDINELEKMAPLAAICMGLAMRRVDDK